MTGTSARHGPRLRLPLATRDLNGVGVGVQRIRDYLNPRGDRPHSHEFVEFNYVVAGHGEHLLGPARFPAQPGSLGITHYDQVHDLATTRAGMEVVNVYLDLARRPPLSLGPDLDPWLARVLPAHPSLSHILQRLVHLQFDPTGPVARLLGQMVAEQEGGRPGRGPALDALLRLLLVEIARHVRERGLYDRRLAASRTDRAVERARRRLEEHHAEPHTLDALAEDAGLAPTSLCRAFRRITGQSVVGYLHGVRLQRAMALLRGGDDAIADIALTVGFGDVSFFNRRFRACTGMTPTAFRRQTPGDGSQRR